MAEYFPVRPHSTTVFCVLQQSHCPLSSNVQLHLTVPSVVPCTMLSSVWHVSVLCLCCFSASSCHLLAAVWTIKIQARLEN